jgi:hypothetical protein
VRLAGLKSEKIYDSIAAASGKPGRITDKQMLRPDDETQHFDRE